MTSPSIARFYALVLAAVPLPVLAQLAPSPPGGSPLLAPAPAAAVPAVAQPQTQIQAAAEQRIAGLQTQLAITQAQAAQWNAFTQVMRENAQSSDTLFRQRAMTAPTMDAVSNLQSYAQLSRANAEGTEKLAAAFQTLYVTFSDQQKQAADTLFRQQAAQGAARSPAVRR